jgi:hypothetical protein
MYIHLCTLSNLRPRLLPCCGFACCLQKKRMAQHGFDMERYQHLMRTRDRYARYLQAQADAPPLKSDASSNQ